jgi:hypothetical protein
MTLAAIVWRDNLDENGCGNLEIKAAAGSGPIIIWSSGLRKHFLSTSLVDCRWCRSDCR